MAKEIPVYLIAGMLDAGKTAFINDTLREGFALQDRTLLISCEEGELEYDKRLLRNVAVETAEEEDDLNPLKLQRWEKEHRPDQVIIEYNGMWPLERIFQNALPRNWVLYQIMVLVDARTFDNYAKNMGQIVMEKIMNADLLIFNRCDDELKASLRKRNLRMANRRAEIYLEGIDGSSENYLTGNEIPFDLSQEVNEIPDNDFGVFYVDAMDHPEHYEGKVLHMQLVMFRSKKWKTPCPGRFAMVCCANDIQFLGMVATGEALEPFQDRQWIDATIRMEIGEHKAYKGKGPIMHVLKAVPGKGCDPEVVSF